MNKPWPEIMQLLVEIAQRDLRRQGLRRQSSKGQMMLAARQWARGQPYTPTPPA